MKSFLKRLRFSFYWGFNPSHPFLLLDAYKHSFTFVTIREPRVETGITFAASILKVQFSLAIYVDKPYKVRSAIMKRIRERQYGKEEN